MQNFDTQNDARLKEKKLICIQLKNKKNDELY